MKIPSPRKTLWLKNQNSLSLALSKSVIIHRAFLFTEVSRLPLLFAHLKVEIQSLSLSFCAPAACGIARAKDQTCATAATCTAAVVTPDPQPDSATPPFLINCAFCLITGTQILIERIN